jgi:hypothetical protein
MRRCIMSRTPTPPVPRRRGKPIERAGGCWLGKPGGGVPSTLQSRHIFLAVERWTEDPRRSRGASAMRLVSKWSRQQRSREHLEVHDGVNARTAKRNPKL